MDVVVTGFGVVSSIGVGRAAFAGGLRSGACGAREIERFDASGYRSRMGAEVRDPLPEGSVVRGTRRYGRAAAFALSALDEALVQAGLSKGELADFGTGLAFGGSTAAMPEAEGELLDDESQYWGRADPALFLGTPVGATAAVLAHRIGLRGPVSTVSTACSSATNALGLAMHWLRSGACERVLAGGSDALCRLTHAGFNSLGVVSPEVPRPLDARRQGMVIGDGAGFFVLERADRAQARGAIVRGRLLGFGNRAEAHHPVQPNPDGSGARAAMSDALVDAGLPPEAVDYVNAHGTGTVHNDAAEARGVRLLLGGRPVPVSSTKSQVGHVLGASGAVELAAVLLAMEGGFIPPTANWAEADPDVDVDPVPVCRDGHIGVALSNSFAFGGNDSSLCVAHPDWSRS